VNSVKLKLNVEIMDIQTKKNLISAILQTSDDEILNEIKKLLKIEDTYDFWVELTEEDQLAINEGIRQLDQGKSISHEEVKDLMKSKFNF
jgi:tRNA(Ser,Leu) C12 N-acetylase TAN1